MELNYLPIEIINIIYDYIKQINISKINDEIKKSIFICSYCSRYKNKYINKKYYEECKRCDNIFCKIIICRECKKIKNNQLFQDIQNSITNTYNLYVDISEIFDNSI